VVQAADYIGFASLGLILIGRASFSFIALARWIANLGAKSATTTASAAKTVADAWSTARELERDRKEQARVEALPKINDEPPAEATALVLPTDDIDLGDACGAADLLAPEETPTKKKRKKREPKVDVEGACRRS
jgi:hypothetical protein